MKKILFFLFLFLCSESRAQQIEMDWTRFIGQSTGCCVVLNSAITSRDGGIVFTGSADASDTTNGDIPASTYGGVLACKIDGSGNILWIHVYGGRRGMGICETSDGGYAILAYAEGVNGYVTGYHGNGDMWLLKIDSIGNFLWGNCYGSNSADEEALSISATKDNGFTLLGISNGSGQDVPYHLGGSEFEYDWFVVKTDSVGNKQWAKDLGGSNDEAPNNFGSILTTDSCYYLVSSTSSLDYDCTDTIWHTGVNTKTDYYILKLDTAGNVVWSRSFGGSGYDEMKSAVWDARDNTILITGASSSNDYMVTANPGGNSMWLIKVDNNGTLAWEKSIGGSYGCGGTSISINHDSGYIVLAGTSGVIGNSDVWIFSVDNHGYVIANKIFGGVYYDFSSTCFTYNHGIIACGSSASNSFTEGTTWGYRAFGEEAFISYLEYWPVSVKNVRNDAAGQLLVFPNPAKGFVTFADNAPDAGADIRIMITNVMGEKVAELHTGNNTGRIVWDTHQQQNGVYMYQATGGGVTSNGKIVVAR